MNIKRLLKHANRFIGVLITHIIVSQWNYFMLTEYASSMIDPTVTDELAQTPLFPLLSAIVSLMSLYSVTRLTSIYERFHMPETLERERNCTNLKERFLCLIHQKPFWIEMAVYAAIYLIFPLEWLHMPYATLLMRGEGFTAKLIALAALLPILFIVTVWARLSAMKYLRTHQSEIDPYKPKESTAGYTKLAIAMGVAYTLGVPALVTLILLAVSFAPIILELLPAIITIIILPPFIRIMRAYRKRKAFVKQLSVICKAKGLNLPVIAYPYRSLFSLFEGESFGITLDGVRYSCKLICALKRDDPLFLYENGEGKFVHTVRFARMNLFTHIKTDRFGYEAEGTKLIIINPIPKKVYFGKNGRSDLIDNGDWVGEYRIYSASAFLGALERDCLDR